MIDAKMEPAAPSASPEIGKTARLDGFHINFHDQGSGPPVLLIHGSGPGVSAWANWRLVLPRLSQICRVIAPDMAGFGHTEAPAGAAYDIDLWIGELLALLDHLGLAKVSVVGNSFGGAIALHLATRHPERVDRIILMGSVGVEFDITPGLEKVWGYEPSPEAMRELIGIFAYDQSLATQDLAEMRYRASVRDDVHERFSALFPAPRQRWIGFLAVDEDKLSALPNEVLLIHGRDDRVIPLSTSQKLANLIPNSQLLVINQCGHWVQIEHPETFTKAVVDFLTD